MNSILAKDFQYRHMIFDGRTNKIIIKKFCKSRINQRQRQLGISWGCVYGVRLPTWTGYLTWVKSQQNGEFHCTRMNSSHLDDISPQSRMIYLHVNSFCRDVPPRQDYYLVQAWYIFISNQWKITNHFIKLSNVDVYQ